MRTRRLRRRRRSATSPNWLPESCSSAGSTARCGRTSAIVDDVPSIFTSIVSISVGSLGGARLTLAICDSMPSRCVVMPASSAQVDRQLLEQGVEDAPDEGDLDLGQLARLDDRCRRPAHEPLDQAQHQRQLGGHQHLRAQRPGTRSIAQIEGCGIWLIARRPGQLVDAQHLQLDRGQQLGRQALAGGPAEALVRALEAPLLVLGELARPREVDVAHAPRAALAAPAVRAAAWPCLAASTSAAT